MTNPVILSIRHTESEFVEITYLLNGEAYTTAMSRSDGDYSPATVYNIVRDQLDRELFYAKDASIDRMVQTHHDSDHRLSDVVEPKGPPWLAETLVQLLAPKKTVQHLLGDLQEMYEKNCVRYGKSRAGRLYWAQVLRSIGPGLWCRVKKFGLIAFLVDYGRSKIGW